MSAEMPSVLVYTLAFFFAGWGLFGLAAAYSAIVSADADKRPVVRVINEEEEDPADYWKKQ